MVEWLPFLGDHFPEGVDFVLAIPKELLAFQGYQHINVYRHLSTDALLAKHILSAGNLVRYLVMNRAVNAYYFKDVHECLMAMKQHNLDNAILQDICAYLSEIGDRDARNFLNETVY